MKDIVVRVRFVFNDEARRAIRRRVSDDGRMASREEIRSWIDSVVTAEIESVMADDPENT